MIKIPKIIVQLVHIQGPLMGQIQDFGQPEISIGRHPACSVQFPNEITILSRHHARIVRDGNRFKIIDQSSNGTFLNGKEIQEAYLKDGDVLMFAEGGPKVSFLTKTVEMTEEAIDTPPVQETSSFDAVATVSEDFPESSNAASNAATSESAGMSSLPGNQQMQQSIPKPAKPPVQPVRTSAVSLTRVKVPLVIQYGPTLRTFNELPITIGKHPNCDFVLEHDQLLDKHLEIFYGQDQYWLKDLTGLNRVSINGQPISTQAALQPDDNLTLSPTGPEFRFLGGGRLAEVETPPEAETTEKDQVEQVPAEDNSSKSTSIFKKLWDRKA